ncbi:MAG: hypothetical protein ABSB70_12055 [Candidatus Velthaea sp.]
MNVDVGTDLKALDAMLDHLSAGSLDQKDRLLNVDLRGVIGCGSTSFGSRTVRRGLSRL